MILIAHRGNVQGSKPTLENSPEYIQNAINLGYAVEVDVWCNSNCLSLGHDEPTYEIGIQWIMERSNKLWIHCKNIEAIEYFSKFIDDVNYSWHEGDVLTLTTSGYIWSTYNIDKGILVMPETFNTSPTENTLGICSDNIKSYKN